MLNKFLTTLASEGKSKNTVRAYSDDVNSLLNYVSKDEKQIDSVIIREYLRSLETKKFTPSTINRKLNSIKSYFKYLTDDNIIKDNPTKKIKSIKLTQNKIPVYLTISETDKLLDIIDRDTETGIRDYTILLMYLNTGIRLSELQGLDIKDIEINERSGSVKILGKGNKYRVVSLNNVTRKAISVYLPLRKGVPGALFTNKNGKRISTRYIDRQLETYGKMAKIEKKISAHILRHTFATNLYDKCKDILAVKEALGHSSITTTTIYAHLDKDKLSGYLETLDTNKYR